MSDDTVVTPQAAQDIPAESGTLNLDRSPDVNVPDVQPRITWDNRRRMAWCCLIAMFICVAYSSLWMPLDRFEKIDTFLQNFLWVCFAVVSVYMGTTGVAAIWSFKGKR